MRRITVIGMIILGLVALPLMAAAKSDNTPAKTQLCHMTGDGEQVLEVSEKAVNGHLVHGDWAINNDAPVEKCGTEPESTSVPILAAISVLEHNCLSMTYCTVTLSSADSTGEIDTYFWRVTDSYGRAFTSYEPNPTIAGSFPGDSIVYLSVSGPDGSDYDSTTITFTSP